MPKTRSIFGPLPPGWKLRRLDELTTKIGSGATPRGGESAYLPRRTKYALIRSQCVHDRYFDKSSISFITDEQAFPLRGAQVRRDDVLLNITGDGVTFSRAAIVPEDVLPACVNQHVAIIRADPSLLSPHYLLAFLSHPLAKPYIEAFNAGGSRRAITKGHIESFVIPYPPLSEQIAIGLALQALDDKIELNRRMNETLEAMAQAVFRDWFVDFGPTRRKLAGITDPVEIMGGLVQGAARATELAALFPDALGDNGLPKGWEPRPIGDLAEIVGGSTPSTKVADYWKNGIHLWATPKDLSNERSIFLLRTERRITDSGLQCISSGLSSAGSVLLSSRAPIGYLAIADQPTAVNQGFIVLRPTPALPMEMAYLWCQANMDLIKANANGSTFQEISKGNFRPLPAIYPTLELICAFVEIAQPMFALIGARERECETLAATRDLLLPKLMSGEIRLREADEIVEAAQ